MGDAFGTGFEMGRWKKKKMMISNIGSHIPRNVQSPVFVPFGLPTGCGRAFGDALKYGIWYIQVEKHAWRETIRRERHARPRWFPVSSPTTRVL